MEKPSDNSVPAQPLPKVAAPEVRSSIPVITTRWELGLAFALGICVILLAQSAWKFWQPPVPLSLAPGSLDLNAASVSELRQLPGVGPQLAQRIVEHRQQHGPFQKIDDLKAVHGIGPATVERMKQFVLVSQHGSTDQAPSTMQPLRSGPKQSPGEPIDLNLATAQQLMTLPGIGPALAERIITERTERGKFESVNDLTRIRGIKGKTLEKIAPFLIVGKPERNT
ncbi:MAG: helix-hairpin-helix domain-containing protein [Gemmatales bacterium]